MSNGADSHASYLGFHATWELILLVVGLVVLLPLLASRVSRRRHKDGLLSPEGILFVGLVGIAVLWLAVVIYNRTVG